MSPANACLIFSSVGQMGLFSFMAPTHKKQKVYVWNVGSALKRHNGVVVAISFASQRAYKEKQSENTCLEMCRERVLEWPTASRTILTAFRVFH